MFRGSQASLVMIVFDLTVQINQAVTFADELRADGQVMTDLELFEFSEENRFTGPPVVCKQKLPTHHDETTMLMKRRWSL